MNPEERAAYLAWAGARRDFNTVHAEMFLDGFRAGRVAHTSDPERWVEVVA